MTIRLSEITGKEQFLSGNVRGKEVFQKLQQKISTSPGVSIFCISLKGIRATDASFPRESVISLVKVLAGEKGIYLKDFSSDDLLDNWDYAAKAKNQNVIVCKNGADYGVIGPELSEGTRQLLDYVLKEEFVTTSKVAEQFHVSAQNASAKMKTLLVKGLVLGSKEIADTGGLEFVYRAIK